MGQTKPVKRKRCDTRSHHYRRYPCKYAVFALSAIDYAIRGLIRFGGNQIDSAQSSRSIANLTLVL